MLAQAEPGVWVISRKRARCRTVRKKEKEEKILRFRVGSVQLKTKTSNRKISVQDDSTHHFFFFSEQYASQKVLCFTKPKEKKFEKDRRKLILLEEIFLFPHSKASRFFLEACPLFLFPVQGSVTKGREKDPLFFSEVVCFPTKSRSFFMPQY